MKKVFLLASIAGLVMTTSCKKGAEAVSDAADATTEAVSDAADATTDAVGDVADATTDAVGDAADAVGDAAEGAVDTVTGAIPEAPKFEDASVQEWANSLYTAAVSAKDAATKGDADALKTAVSEITSLSQTLTSFKGANLEKAQEYYNTVKKLIE